MKKIPANIFSICFSLFLLFSCTTDDRLMYDIKQNEFIDLSAYIKKEFDYIILLNMGVFSPQECLKNNKIDIDTSNVKPWLGERILYVKDNIIICQYNIPYYISEPKKNYYISFFEDDEVSSRVLGRNETKCLVKRIRHELARYKFDLYYLEPVKGNGSAKMIDTKLRPFCWAVSIGEYILQEPAVPLGLL